MLSNTADVISIDFKIIDRVFFYHILVMLKSQQQRTATPENSHQSQEQVNKKNKARTLEFVQQLPTPRAEEKRDFY